MQSEHPVVPQPPPPLAPPPSPQRSGRHSSHRSSQAPHSVGSPIDRSVDLHWLHAGSSASLSVVLSTKVSGDLTFFAMPLALPPDAVAEAFDVELLSRGWRDGLCAREIRVVG